MATKTKTTKTKKVNGKKKQAIDAPRGAGSFKLNPFELVILGVDTSDPIEGTELRMLLHKHRITKPLEKDLLDSIKTSGVENAITTAKVWLPVGMTVHGRVLKTEELHVIAIDGRRRTLHTRHLCIEAGDKDGTKGSYALKVWPPKTGWNLKELAGLAIELNETSRHDDVLEKAEQAKIMVAQTQDKAWVAAKFGVDPQTIDGWFKLRSEAAPKVLDAVRAKRGGINATGATKLTRLPPSKQVEVMEEAISKGKTSTKQIEGMVRKAVAEANGVKPNERPDVTPTKRHLGGAIEVLDEGDLSFDDFVTWDKTAREVLLWVKDGVISGPRIKELAEKGAIAAKKAEKPSTEKPSTEKKAEKPEKATAGKA